MSKLFEPIRLRDLEIRNRIWIAPMCQYSCENQDGVASDWHLVHLGSRASGGAGLVIAEATAVEPIGRISPWDTGIWNEEQVEAWKPVTAFIKSQGAKSALQIAHAGRKASIYREWSGSGSIPIEDGGWQTISSTSEPFEGYAAPRELSTEEVKAIAPLFGAATERAIRAGFDTVEIHAAHGYLIHQFLSPLCNKRTDEYGGSLENRARLLLEIVAACRAALPAGAPLLIRFSAKDWIEGGWDEAQTAQVGKWCEEAGVDFFDISTGGVVLGAKIPFGPNYQVPAAEYVAERVGEPVGAVGLITEAAQAEAILQSGEISVILIGRAALRDPYWPLRAAAELGVELDYWPRQYSRGKWPKS